MPSEASDCGAHSKKQLAKARAFLGLIRIDYSLLIASALIVSGVLSGDLTGLQPEYLVGIAAAFALAMATFAINDYYDYEADKVNERPDKPLVQGLIGRKTARSVAAVFYALGLALSLLLNPVAAALMAVLAAMTFFYSFGLKRVLVMKNVIVALCIALGITVGSLVSDAEVEPLVAYFALLGFIIDMGLEATKDIYDVRGDTKAGVRTIAAISKPLAAKVATLFFIIFAGLLLLPFFANVDARLFGDALFLCAAAPAAAACILMSRSLLKDQGLANVERITKAVSLVMALGMAAYLVGIIF